MPSLSCVGLPWLLPLLYRCVQMRSYLAFVYKERRFSIRWQPHDCQGLFEGYPLDPFAERVGVAAACKRIRSKEVGVPFRYCCPTRCWMTRVEYCDPLLIERRISTFSDIPPCFWLMRFGGPSFFRRPCVDGVHLHLAFFVIHLKDENLPNDAL